MQRPEVVFAPSAIYNLDGSATLYPCIPLTRTREIVPVLTYRSLLGFLTMLALTALCYEYLDHPLALAIASVLMHPQAPDLLQLPDLLLAFVAIVTVCSWTGRVLLAGKPEREHLRSFLTSAAIVAPASFIAKEICKFVFGRIETRKWLLNTRLDGFHWLNGVGHFNGFPSGHMMVLAALTAVMWRYYPRLKIYYALALASLGIALIVTDYHFISDVIAGGYGGLVVERLFARRRELLMLSS